MRDLGRPRLRTLEMRPALGVLARAAAGGEGGEGGVAPRDGRGQRKVGRLGAVDVMVGKRSVHSRIYSLLYSLLLSLLTHFYTHYSTNSRLYSPRSS